VLAHLHALLEAVDAELARREEVKPC
jgi:hypothetical protein